MLLKVLLLTLSLLCLRCDGKPQLLATSPVSYVTPGGAAWYPTVGGAAIGGAPLGAAYYPAYAAYTYTPVYYGSYATYPYYTYFRR